MPQEITRIDEDTIEITKTVIETEKICHLEEELAKWEAEVSNLKNRPDLVAAEEQVNLLKEKIAARKALEVGVTVTET